MLADDGFCLLFFYLYLIKRCERRKGPWDVHVKTTIRTVHAIVVTGVAVSARRYQFYESIAL